MPALAPQTHAFAAGLTVSQRSCCRVRSSGARGIAPGWTHEHQIRRRNVTARVAHLQLGQAHVVRWDPSDWASAYATVAESANGYWADVDGVLPPELNGTLWRNGPGEFEVGSSPVAHPFDGDGLVCSLEFRDGRVFFRSRFVQTAEHEAEQQAGRRLFRCTFGTSPSGGLSKSLLNFIPKNTANTNILQWGSKCWAMFESGLPYIVDAASLSTVGVDNLEGSCRAGAPFATGARWLDDILSALLHPLVPRALASCNGAVLGGDAVSAHPRLDPRRARLIWHSYQLRLHWNLRGWQDVWQRAWLALDTRVVVHELSESGQVMARTAATLPGYAFLHDIAFTDNYYVLYQNPVQLSLLPLVLGLRSPVHCVEWAPQRGAACHLVPRPHARPQPTIGTESPPPADRLLTQGTYTRDRTHVAAAGAQCTQPEHGHTAPSQSHGSTAEGAKMPEVFDASSCTRVVAMPPVFIMHSANAHESFDEQGRRIVVWDSVQYPSMVDFHALSGPGSDFRHADPDKQPPSWLVRCALDVEGGQLLHSFTPSSLSMEFPRVSPAHEGCASRFVYTTSSASDELNCPAQVLAKVDMASGVVEHWTRGDRYYVGEPVFVLRDGAEHSLASASEDAGWLLSVCYDAVHQRSEVVVLDAQRLCDGPVACVRLRGRVPHGLHGNWTPAKAAVPPPLVTQCAN